MSREVTNELVELVDEGLLDAYVVLRACLAYMSEDEVADMASCNELYDDEDEEEDED